MDGCNVIMNMKLPLQLQKGIYDFIHILQMLKVNIKVKGVILPTISTIPPSSRGVYSVRSDGAMLLTPPY